MIAVLPVVVALAVRLGLDPILGPNEEFLVFPLAILVAAYFGGRAPGLAATALGILLSWYFLLEPRYSFGVANLRDAGSLAVLAGTGIAICLLAARPVFAPAAESHRLSASTNRPFVRRTVLLGGVFVLLLVLTNLLYDDFQRERDRQAWVTHTYDVLIELQFLTSTLQDAETAQRDYLLTGEGQHLQTFQSAIQRGQSSSATLRRLTSDNPGQENRLDELDRLVEARLNALQQVMAIRSSLGAAAALAKVRSVQDTESAEQCHAMLRAVEEEERRLLGTRSVAAEAQALRTRWVLGLGSGSLLMLLLLAGAVIERDIQNREQTRQALLRNEQRLRLALDAANAGAWEWNLKTNENVWSEELWKVYGLEPHSCQPSFEAWRQLVHPDDRARAEQVVREAALTGGEMNVEFRVRNGNGSDRWLLSRAQQFLDGKGKGERFVGIAVDITQRKQAEEALREREQNLRRFTEVAPVAIAMFDRDMRYLAASQRFRDDYHLGGQEILGRSHYEIFPEIPRHWREIHARCLAGAVERHPGEEFLRLAGAPQWIRWEIQPWRRADSEIGGIVLFSEDISGQTRSEEALRDSEQQFRTLANAIPQLCWMANADGWIFWYNQRWYQYTGTTPEQMEGWGWQSVHDPAALPKVVERWKVSLANGEPFDMVFPLRAADGAFHPFLTRIQPVRDRDGNVVRWFGTNTDITEQKKTEEALRKASEQRRLALDAAELGTWECHRDSGDLFWDETCRNMFGFGHEHRIGYSAAFARIHPDHRAAVEEAMQVALTSQHGGAFHQEFPIFWPDGSEHWVAFHGRLNFDAEEAGRPAYLAGVAMDITRRKQADLEIRQLNAQLEQRVRERTAQLETANRELEAFSYSVSHDLRAPLRGIDGWSLALAEDYAGQLDERAHQYLDRVRSETQRMGLLIDDMLQLSRVARTEMQFVRVNLTAIAGQIAGGLKEANSGRSIDFAIEPNLTAPGDPRLLEIVLTNLLANAVKFTGTRDKARIEFGLADAAGSPAFYVRDNGVGFDMAYAAGIFGAFQRLHKASEFPGTGIGLAIVQRVIHRHGGRIWTEAKPDVGAVFYFTLGPDV